MNVHCKWKSLVQPLPQFMKMQDTDFRLLVNGKSIKISGGDYIL
ncbi:MAG: hypothetical protein ACLR6O_04215 [Eubacterium sp.]